MAMRAAVLGFALSGLTATAAAQTVSVPEIGRRPPVLRKASLAIVTEYRSGSRSLASTSRAGGWRQ
jgi:hypothetical protein